MSCICRLGARRKRGGGGGLPGGSKNTYYIGSQSNETYAMWQITFTWEELGGESIVT